MLHGLFRFTGPVHTIRRKCVAEQKLRVSRVQGPGGHRRKDLTSPFFSAKTPRFPLLWLMPPCALAYHVLQDKIQYR